MSHAAADIAGLATVMNRERASVRDVLARNGRRIEDFQAPRGGAALRYFLTVWGCVAVLAVLWRSLPGAAALLLVPLLGVVQHAMLNIVHEASHGLLLADRRAGDRLANLLAALPIAHTVASYRVTHLDHHAFLRTERDPSGYVTRPDLTTADIRRTVVFLLCGRLAWELAARTLFGRRFQIEASGDGAALKATDRRRLVAVTLFHGVTLALCAATGLAGFWIAWVVVLLTLTPALDGLRTLIEHRALPEDVDFHTRSHHRSVVVSALMAPFFQYHWEHHLFPGVPHSRLVELHRVLLEAGVPGAQPAAGGFVGVMLRVL